MALPPGRKLGPYEILSPIGAGGMGEVYLAVDTKLKRQVALKFLPEELTREEERRQRFILEARAAAAIEHPHIAAIHDIDEVDGRTFIAMEHIRGESVREAIRKKKLNPRKSIELAIEVADGLSVAHEKGIVHRDLKPENILISEQGYAKIIDFGLAKLLEPLLPGGGEDSEVEVKTRSGVVLGSVSYMSPEQARGKAIDGRSDVFSFGLVLYEMLAGANPFRRENSVETLHAILKDTTPALQLEGEVKPPGIEPILRKALAKDPEARYQGMKDLAADLRTTRRRLEQGYESPADLASELKDVPETSPAWRARRRVLWASAGLLAVSVVFAFAPNLIRLSERLLPSATRSPIEPIAVLPLHNLSGDPEQEYFADGLTEALITDLAKIGALKVISRTSAMR